MVIIRLSKDLSTHPQLNESLIVALGQFDGLHEAHQVLIKKAVALAREKNCKSAVVSFDPHPDIILKKQTDLSYLTPLDKKCAFIANLGVDYLMIVEFDEDVARLSHQEFVKSYLLALGVRGVVVGFDYRYGYAVWATARRLKPIRTGLSKLPSSTKSNMIIKNSDRL